MTTRITITGTGTPIPTPDRAGPGVLIERGRHALQFDAGRNSVARLIAAGSSPGELSGLFLTHYHSDHLVGLADVVLTRWVMDRGGECGPLPIVAPEGATATYCERMLDAWVDDLAVRSEHNGRATDHLIELETFATPDRPALVWSDDDVRVLAGPVRHEPVIGAVGYRVETPDGVVAISGDTKVCDEVAALAAGADVLVYEAIRSEVINRRPPHLRYILEYHADTIEIGAQAAELAVPTLVLTHLIPAPTTPAERQDYVDDVRSGGYGGTVIVADDLESVTIG
jgi:ribonuclease Z